MYYQQTVFFQAPNIVMPPPLTWHGAWWVNIGQVCLHVWYFPHHVATSKTKTTRNVALQRRDAWFPCPLHVIHPKAETLSFPQCTASEIILQYFR